MGFTEIKSSLLCCSKKSSVFTRFVVHLCSDQFRCNSLQISRVKNMITSLSWYALSSCIWSFLVATLPFSRELLPTFSKLASVFLPQVTIEPVLLLSRSTPGAVNLHGGRRNGEEEANLDVWILENMIEISHRSRTGGENQEAWKVYSTFRKGKLFVARLRRWSWRTLRQKSAIGR